MQFFRLLLASIVFACVAAPTPSGAQCAGCGADFNKQERDRLAREQREADARDKQLRDHAGGVDGDFLRDLERLFLGDKK